MQPKKLSKREQLAAQLVFEDEFTDQRIAAAVDIDKGTLERWKKRPLFQAQIEVLRAAHEEALVAEGIARRQNRIDALNGRWTKMSQVIDERAETMGDECPGGGTGLMVRDVKIANNGDYVEQFAVDTGLLRELRAHEQQAAQELGQWAEKHEHSGEVTVRRYVGINPEDV